METKSNWKLFGPVTQRSVLDAFEQRYVTLRGAIRQHNTLRSAGLLLRTGFEAQVFCFGKVAVDFPQTPLSKGSRKNEGLSNRSDFSNHYSPERKYNASPHHPRRLIGLMCIAARHFVMY